MILNSIEARKEDGTTYKVWVFWCPGCNEAHSFSVGNPTGPSWTFDGNLESPTFSPSLLYNRPENAQPGRCHLFIRDGRIEYCGDCAHGMAGWTIPMVHLPGWWGTGE